MSVTYHGGQEHSQTITPLANAREGGNGGREGGLFTKNAPRNKRQYRWRERRRRRWNTRSIPEAVALKRAYSPQSAQHHSSLLGLGRKWKAALFAAQFHVQYAFHLGEDGLIGNRFALLVFGHNLRLLINPGCQVFLREALVAARFHNNVADVHANAVVMQLFIFTVEFRRVLVVGVLLVLAGRVFLMRIDLCTTSLRLVDSLRKRRRCERKGKEEDSESF